MCTRERLEDCPAAGVCQRLKNLVFDDGAAVHGQFISHYLLVVKRLWPGGRQSILAVAASGERPRGGTGARVAVDAIAETALRQSLVPSGRTQVRDAAWRCARGRRRGTARHDSDVCERSVKAMLHDCSRRSKRCARVSDSKIARRLGSASA